MTARSYHRRHDGKLTGKIAVAWSLKLVENSKTDEESHDGQRMIATLNDHPSLTFAVLEESIFNGW